MGMQIADFVSEIAINSRIHRGNTNRLAELNAIATALSSDTATYPTTMQAPPAGLKVGDSANTKFTNDILLVVNNGKSSGLTPTAMSNAITAGLSQFLPPVNTSAPAVTGTGTVGNTLTCTTGNWSYVPTSYGYQWQRGGAGIAGATASTYVLVAADSGSSIACLLTANNAAGSSTILSNAIACA